MSGNSDGNGNGKALSTILDVWYDDAVKIDYNGGWSCDFNFFFQRQE